MGHGKGSPAHTSKDGLHPQSSTRCTSGACLPNSALEAGCADGNAQRAPAAPHASACVTMMPYGSSSGSDVLAEATPPVCRTEVASPGPPAPGGAGNSAAQDADCGGSCGTEEEIKGEADCASADLTQDDTTTSSTTATDATSADGSLSESEPLTPTTPLQLSVPLLPPAEDPNRMTLVLVGWRGLFCKRAEWGGAMCPGSDRQQSARTLEDPSVGSPPAPSAAEGLNRHSVSDVAA